MLGRFFNIFGGEGPQEVRCNKMSVSFSSFIFHKVEFTLYLIYKSKHGVCLCGQKLGSDWKNLICLYDATMMGGWWAPCTLCCSVFLFFWFCTKWHFWAENPCFLWFFTNLKNYKNLSPKKFISTICTTHLYEIHELIFNFEWM